MTTQHTDQDTLREQVRARYAAAATKVTSGDCGCGQPADCGCDSGCCGAASAEEPGFGAELYEGPHSFELASQRILVVHDIGDVQPRSIEGHSIVVHGFTHQQEMKTRGDTLIVNPGEACGWLYGTPKAAILDLDTKQVEFLSLDPAHWTT